MRNAEGLPKPLFSKHHQAFRENYNSVSIGVTSIYINKKLYTKININTHDVGMVKTEEGEVSKVDMEVCVCVYRTFGG